MTTPQGIPLPGCRHDVLGHALKAIGVLRALCACASPQDRDPSAEGWWDRETAAFVVRSERYPDAGRLAQFFAEKYRPTPLIAAWNKGGGVTDKMEITISGSAKDLRRFAERHAAALKEVGLTSATAKKQLEKGKPLSWSPESAAISEIRGLLSDTGLSCCVSASIAASVDSLKGFVAKYRDKLETFGLPKDIKVLRSGKLEFEICWEHLDELQQLLVAENLPRASTRKESAKKDGTLPAAERLHRDGEAFSNCLALVGRQSSIDG
jgi:CRISPR-associated protein Csx17